MKADVIAKNLLADQTCKNCEHLGRDGFELKSVFELPPGDYCALNDLVRCPEEGTCENWLEKRVRPHLILGSAYSIKRKNG